MTGIATAFDRERLIEMPEKLRLRQEVFSTTGGLHAAAAFSPNGEISLVREDIGRHNAVDKVIGALLMSNRLPARELGLLVSGRASFELMQKALVAGFPLLAAVGAPSSLAVSLAKEFDMTLVGFLRRGNFNIYSRAERLS
jgi:FdhD protein